MIRPATLADADAIFDIALIHANQYQGLRPDIEKMRKGIVQAISTAKHIALVAEHKGKVTGTLIGLTSENLWAQRSNCLVVLWYSKIAGDGINMLRAFKKWVRSRRVIRVAGFVSDSEHIGRRTWLLVEHMGFYRYGGAYLLYN